MENKIQIDSEKSKEIGMAFIDFFAPYVKPGMSQDDFANVVLGVQASLVSLAFTIRQKPQIVCVMAAAALRELEGHLNEHS